MRSLIWLALLVGFGLLMVGTVMVFLAFDRVSHSNSDTLRPFVITMAPVWAVAIAAAIVLLRRPGSS
jgi:NADH:ubiquinone oxidoreductase subunit K